MAIQKHQIPLLKQLRSCKNITKRRALLERGGTAIQAILREIAYNLLKGNLKLTKKQLSNLKKHKKAVRVVASKKPSIKRRIKLEQRGGFLSALLTPVLTALAGSILG